MNDFLPRDSTISTYVRMSNDEILSSGSLTVLVPETGTGEGRKFVFYDETVPIEIKLELEDGKDVDFAQVAIAVELRVVGIVYEKEAALERSYVTHSQIITDAQLINKEDNVATWKIDAPVEHPRTRLIQPRVVVDAVLNVAKSVEEVQPTVQTSSRYLQQFKPVQEINLFQALGHNDANLSRLQSSLSASRIRLESTAQQAATATNQSPDPTQDNYDLKKLSAQVTMPVYPALNLRLRTTKAHGIHDDVVAILEVASSEYAKVDVQIDSAAVDLLGGSATLLGQVELPLTITPGESLTMSFNLYHSDVFILSKEQQPSRLKPMSIVVECTPLSQGNPSVKTKWDTTVDFDVMANAATAPPAPVAALPPTTPNPQTAPGTPSMRKLMRLSRTSSSASLPSAARVQTDRNSTQGGGGTGNSSKWSNSNLQGLSLSFSGPSTVKVGESFQWKVFAVNRSNQARNLSLYVQSIDKAFEKSLPRNSELYPVIDRAALKRMHNISSLGAVGLISVNNDIRIGPLYAQSCYETEISILALSAGVHTLEGVSILDQTNGEMYDCGKLLEVVVNDN